MNKQKAIEILKVQKDEIRKMHAMNRTGASFTKWRRDTVIAIENIFKGDAAHLRDFKNIDYMLLYEAPADEKEREYHEDLERAEAVLDSFIQEIEKYWPEDTIESKKIALQPWPAISTYLFNLSSDEVVDIIASTGLQVNWSLTKEESFSHATRNRAYRPRVDAAYAALQDDDKLRVAWIVTSEILRKNPTLETEISKSLDLIGWKIVSGTLQPAYVEVSEIFFPRGSVHGAYVKIRTILQSASESLIIIDPYLNSEIFTLLRTMGSHPLEVKLLGFNFPADFGREAALFQKEYRHITILARKCMEFHDRFIIVEGTKCFHLGASIKDAGSKVCMINQIQDAENARLLIEQQQSSWNSATVII